MIQRIQTVYLITAALMVLLGLFFNYFEAGVTPNNDVPAEKVTITALTIDYYQEGEGIIHSESPVFLTALTILSFVVIGGVIFIYRNRTLQVKLVRLSILLVAANMMLIFFYYSDSALAMLTKEPDSLSYDWGVYLAIFAMLLLFLAQKSIIRDEKLVRSADRLR